MGRGGSAVLAVSARFALPALPTRPGRRPVHPDDPTQFTLFMVPVVYTLLDDFVTRLRRGRSSSAHAPRVVHAGPAVRDPQPVAADGCRRVAREAQEADG
jgi:hypothetical protein